MSAEKKPKSKQPTELGPTNRNVGENVRRLKEVRKWSFPELERQLEERAKRTIPVIGLRRIEANQRRVDVDDLTALAVTFGVSPIDLLYDPGSNQHEITGVSAAEFDRREIDLWLEDTIKLEHDSAQRHWSKEILFRQKEIERHKSVLKTYADQGFTDQSLTYRKHKSELIEHENMIKWITDRIAELEKITGTKYEAYIPENPPIQMDNISVREVTDKDS